MRNFPVCKELCQNGKRLLLNIRMWIVLPTNSTNFIIYTVESRSLEVSVNRVYFELSVIQIKGSYELNNI